MLSFIFNMTIFAAAAAFGWKAASWQSNSKKLKAENKELKKELYYYGSENRELKIQLGLPPERRLALQLEPDLTATISDAQMAEERKSGMPQLSGYGMSPMIALLGTAAIVHMAATKKDESNRKKLKALRRRLEEKVGSNDEIYSKLREKTKVAQKDALNIGTQLMEDIVEDAKRRKEIN